MSSRNRRARPVLTSVVVLGLAFAAVKPAAEQQPAGATIRVTPSNGEPPDSLRLGQPFNVSVNIPDDWNPGPSITVSLSDGDNTQTLTLTRGQSANGVTMYFTTAAQSIAGTRGGTVGLFGFKTDGTIAALDDLTNGGTVTVRLEGFRGPQTNVSTSLPVYDDELQQGIARNDAMLTRMQTTLTAQQAALAAVPTANMPPDVKAEYDATVRDVNMRLGWIAEARTVLLKHDTPRGDYDIGTTYLSAITRQDFGLESPHQYKQTQVSGLMERLEDVVPAMFFEGLRAVTLANYKIVSELSGAGAAYRAGQLVTDPLMEWAGHNPGFARDEFGRPITTSQQVWAVVEVGANAAGIFAGPKLIDWLAGQGMLRGATPRPGGPLTPSPPRNAGSAGGRGTASTPRPGTQPGTGDATEPGALRRPTIDPNAGDTLRVPPGAAANADDTVRVPRGGAANAAVDEGNQIARLRAQARDLGVQGDEIAAAMKKGSNREIIGELQARVDEATQDNEKFMRIFAMNHIDGIEEARIIARNAGVPEERIVEIIRGGGTGLERVRMLTREALQRQGIDLTAHRGEIILVNQIYTRARSGTMTAEDLEFIAAGLRSDPDFFRNLARRGNFGEHGFEPVLPVRAAVELGDLYRAQLPGPVTPGPRPSTTPVPPPVLDLDDSRRESLPANSPFSSRGDLSKVPDSVALAGDYAEGTLSDVRFALDEVLQAAGFDMAGSFRRDAATGTVTYEDGEVTVTGRASGGRLIIEKGPAGDSLTTGSSAAQPAIDGIEMTLVPGSRPAENETFIHLGGSDLVALNDPSVLAGGRDETVQLMFATFDDSGALTIQPSQRRSPAAQSVGRRMLGALTSLLPRRARPAADHSPFTAAPPAHRPVWLAPIGQAGSKTAAGQPVRMILTSLGTSTGEAFQVQVINDGPAPVRIDGAIVLEPIAAKAQQAVRQQLQRAMPRGATALTVNAYCLEFLRVPPSSGTIFRIAPAPLQQKFAPMRNVMQAVSRMRDAGLLTPDIDPRNYFHAIRQWALWTKLQGFTLESFGAAFVEHTRKNVQASGGTWNRQLEEALRRVVPHRWSQINAVIAEADRLAAAPASGGQHAQR